MALSDEDPATIAPYIDQMGITVPVAAGSNASPKYGVKGIPSSCLIGPDGKVVWAGSPYALSSGTVKDALKGAKPRPSNFLAVVPSTTPSAKLAPSAKAMEQGKLGKALPALAALKADPAAAAPEREEADALSAEIDAHLAILKTQAESFVSSRDVLSALVVYDAIAKELGALEPGAAAQKRADEIRKDPALAKELEAAQALEKLRGSVAKLASSKAKDKYKEFAGKYKGTRAGDRARSMSTTKD
jgi:hypothetical protein